MAEDETSTPDTQGAESAFHLMDGLRSNLKDAEKGISRQLILITILSAFFILLARNQIGSITFQAVPIINHYFVQAFLPVIIAALYLSAVNTMQMAIELIGAHDALVRKFQPEINYGYEERLLWPSTGAFAALAALPVLLESKTARRTTRAGSWTRYLIYFTDSNRHDYLRDLVFVVALAWAVAIYRGHSIIDHHRTTLYTPIFNSSGRR